MDRGDLITGLILGLFLALPLFLILSKPAPIPQTRYTTTNPVVEEWEVIKNRETGRTEGVRIKRAPR